MAGTMDMHELPIPPSLDSATVDETLKLAGDKYEQTVAWAKEAQDKMQEFFLLITNYLDTIGNINTDIPIDDFDFTIPIDLISLIRGIPESPLTAADYEIDVPDALVWNYTEEFYLSDLKDKFRERLSYILTYGGGALAEVEDDIFAREAERDALINEDAKTQAADNWAKRNQEFPGLGLFSTLARIDQDYQNKRLDKSRAIAEESRKVEIGMEQNVFEQINKLEATEMEHFSKSQDRRLAAAKAVIDYGLALVDAQIKVLQAKVTAYAEEVKAYVAHTDAVSKVVGVYIAVIEARIKYITAKIQASVAELDAKIKEATMKHGLALENWKVQLQVSAQIAASAMAAFHASASISSGYSESNSRSIGLSESYSHSEDNTPA